MWSRCAHNREEECWSCRGGGGMIGGAGLHIAMVGWGDRLGPWGGVIGWVRVPGACLVSVPFMSEERCRWSCSRS